MTGRPSAPDRQADLAPAPAPAIARLRKHAERLAWIAYLRALRLQRAEPGPTSTIIRDTTFKVWEQTFLGQSST